MPLAFNGGGFLLDSTWLGLNEVQAVLIAAALAGIIAIWGIFSQRAISARQTTIQYLRDAERDHDMIQARSTFQRLTKEPAGLAVYGSEKKAQSEEARSIKMVLNDYELLAIGIERGILDDKTYRRWFRSAAVKDWRNAAPYVMAIRHRTSNDALFHEFEEMARRYRDGKGMPRRTIIWSKFF